MPTGALVGVLEAHYLRVAHVRFSEDGSAFVSASDDGQALIWSLPTCVLFLASLFVAFGVSQ